MKTYTIARISGEPDWSQIPVLAVDEYLWGTTDEIAMQAQFCYDESAIYVHMQAREPSIRAEHHAPLSMICEDSCMEFFFSPQPGDDRYLNIEINPNAYTFLGISHCRQDNVRLCPPNEEALFRKNAGRTADGWEVFYRIPVSYLRVFFPDCRLESGREILANVYKCGDLTVKRHYLSWNPVSSPVPDFHRSCDFGRMVLE